MMSMIALRLEVKVLPHKGVMLLARPLLWLDGRLLIEFLSLKKSLLKKVPTFFIRH